MKHSKLLMWALNACLIVGLLAFAGCGDDDEDPAPTGLTADAGPDQTVDLGETVTLAGSATDAAGGTVILTWAITSSPTGSIALITNPLVANATFIPDLAGSYTLTLTAANTAGDTATDDVIITVEQPDFVLVDQDIVTDTNWPDLGPGIDYVVSGFLDIDANLTIDPGVLIHFEQDGGFEITSSGTLSAVGTAADSIIFTGATETPGFWRGLLFTDSDNNINEFTYCRISYGGSSNLSSEVGQANVGFGYFLNPSRIKFNNTLVRDADGKGIAMDHRTNGRFPEFSNNRVSGNSDIAMIINVISAGDLEGSTEYSNNGTDAVEVLSKNTTKALEDNAMWPVLSNGVPYHIEANILIEADLVIEAGAILEFGSDVFMRVNEDGSLLAAGTMTDRIVFTGKTKTKGFWRGLYFEDSNNVINELTYMTFEYGGSSDLTNQLGKTNFGIGYFLNPSKLKMSNIISRESDGTGFAIDYRSNGELTVFENNQFSSNTGAGIQISPFQLQYLDEATVYTDNNGNDFIEVSHPGTSAPVGDGTWVRPADGSLYLMDCETIIEGDVVINPGAVFEFEANKGLRIDGSLSAVGAASDRIVFTGVTKSAGAWKGIQFRSTNSVNNKLQFVDIAFGGSDEFGVERANLNLEDFPNNTLVDVQDCSFTNSAGYGIALAIDAAITPVSFETANTFSNNASGNVFNQ
ncbi:MAG: hypothetical protein AAGA02_00360 [Bacteroidota bacterium]